MAASLALVIFRLAHHFEHNPTLISNLVSLTIQGIAVNAANQALQAGPVSNEIRQALEVELAIHERMDGFVWSIKSDRPNMLDYMNKLVPGRNFWLLSRGIANMQESACLEVYSTLIELARNPAPYRQAQQTIDGKNSAMAAIFLPGLKAAYVALVRTRAEIRCLRVLNALQTHVLVGSKETPKLSELGLPAETITDPFNGEPLHVKKLPQGWLVYSVGQNLRDDGGKLDDPLNGDVGVGPPPPAEKSTKN